MSTIGHDRDARVLALALAGYDTDAIARQLGRLRDSRVRQDYA